MSMLHYPTTDALPNKICRLKFGEGLSANEIAKRIGYHYSKGTTARTPAVLEQLVRQGRIQIRRIPGMAPVYVKADGEGKRNREVA